MCYYYKEIISPPHPFVDMMTHPELMLDPWWGVSCGKIPTTCGKLKMKGIYNIYP
jgi:hypothetical protein